MAAPNRIYIGQKTGKYAGKIIVFDHVEAMNQTSTSVITNHPVEYKNQNKADHRFHNGIAISIAGMISDNWQTTLVNDPTPVFETMYYKKQKTLRLSAAADIGQESFIFELMTRVLQGETIDPEELQVGYEEYPSDYWYVAVAQALVNSESDMIESAQNKNMSISESESNADLSNGNINTITEAQEMLEYWDANDSILTVTSMWKTYENMVLTNYSNPLRNGPQRGAYWVNLNLKEELISQAIDVTRVVSPENSEEVDEEENEGKNSRNVVDIYGNDPAAVAVRAIYNEQLANRTDPGRTAQWVDVNSVSKDRILEDGLDAYQNASGAEGLSAASSRAGNSINLNFSRIESERGKVKWPGN